MHLVEVTPDWKPQQRIVNKRALQRALANNYLGSRCWACRKRQATEAHHIVFRSDLGDDVEENLAPLCMTCHDAFHALRGADRTNVPANIGRSLREENIVYVLRKKGIGPGQDFLRRRYKRSVSARLTKQLRREA
jgi:hypothetical protein